MNNKDNNVPNLGKVVSVRGSVVDVRFDRHLPPIYALLHAQNKTIVMEVLMQLDAHHVRGIALTPTQGLARGMVVEDTGGPLKAPVVGLYQLQAAVAAIHDEAARAEDTDWPQILSLYELLKRVSPSPMATLNHAIATAMVHGPARGLELLKTLDSDARFSEHHRLDAVRAHLLEMLGDRENAIKHYRTQPAGRRAFRNGII